MSAHLHKFRIMNITWSLLTLCITVLHCASTYNSNSDFLLNPNFEPICTEHQERFIESDGKESSLILEFNSGPFPSNSSTGIFCKRILSAPESYGFIVRLIRPKIRKNIHRITSSSEEIQNGMEEGQKSKKIDGNTLKDNVKTNSTAFAAIRSCPLSVFSSLDPFKASWLVDPCQLEDATFDIEDPVRLFQGRLRIIWEHRNHALDSKLMVTVLGKGAACQRPNKHSCLKIGLEPLLCISKDLVCDGIRHCPYSNEYDSDEDYEMCWKRKKIYVNNESDIWEHWAIEIFRNLFAFDVPTLPASTTIATPTNSDVESRATTIRSAGVNSTTTLTKLNSTMQIGTNVTTLGEGKVNATAAGGHKRNSTRTGLNSDLSKYGPWGYLMLGMLLCGGALLICGLWASASQSGQNEGDSSMQQGSVAIGNSSMDQQSSLPPNYEELDPPPPYSVLFPNQKAMSTATLAEHINQQSEMATIPVADSHVTRSADVETLSEPRSSSIRVENTNSTNSY